MNTIFSFLSKEEQKIIEDACVSLCAKSMRDNFRGKVKKALHEQLNGTTLFSDSTITFNFPVKISWSFMEYLLEVERSKKSTCQAKKRELIKNSRAEL